MPKICYKTKKFSKSSLELIDKANEIIDAFAEDGIDPTLRQVYYQFVSQNAISNTENEYHRLGGIISDARLAGLIDWDSITDRTRSVKRNSTWQNPGGIIKTCVNSYNIDMWVGQKHRPWCLIEKDALVGVFQTPCWDLDVPLLSCRGYLSQSEAWGTGRAMRDQILQGLIPIILHFGDHDPAGLDMTRDLRERMSLFAEKPVELIRVALNRDQVDEYEPPPNPAKTTDRKFQKYQAEHGNYSWELDALSPTVLRDLLRGEVEKLIDENAKQKRIDLLAEHKQVLRHLSRNWERIPREDTESDEEVPDLFDDMEMED